MPSFARQRAAFRALHESGCFLIPNPWDVGSARYLQQLGFGALATTSAGFAFSRGLPDGAVPLDAMLAHIANLVAATDLPVNADFGDGFADSPSGVGRNVKLCLQTGVAGLSIEDATGNDREPLYPIDQAIERIAAARAAIDRAAPDVLLIGRAECYLTEHPQPLAEVTRRLQAYSAAGADVLYAPGLTDPEEIRAIVAAVAPKPINLLVSSDIGLTLDQIAALGVRRVSVGSSLARVAWQAFISAAQQLGHGSFRPFAAATPFAELNRAFKT